MAALERIYHPTPAQLLALAALYEQTGLAAAGRWDCLAAVWEDSELAAAGIREGKVLTHLAAAPGRQGEGLMAAVVSELVKEAAEQGIYRLFLFTKPKNREAFSALGFYPLAETEEAAMLENQRDGLAKFLRLIPVDETGQAGCIVAHANPFTLGHLALVEKAAAQCRRVYLFILAEETAPFSPAERLKMAKKAVKGLPGVMVLSGGDYLVSAATFPDYFYPDRAAGRKANCQLDLTLFGQKIAPALGIGIRFVGTEPFSRVTDDYNRAMAELLPGMGVRVSVMPRVEISGLPISASQVRQALAAGDFAEAKRLCPFLPHKEEGIL